jgi:putative YhbY family RNA-binding protein
MAELTLPQEQILALRAQAHRLEPVVLLGAAGLSEAALREIDRALGAHGLVKVRAGRLERADRDEMYARIAMRLSAARVQVIGHTFVLFRPLPDAPPPRKASVPKKKAAARQTSARPAPTARRPARPGATPARRAR